MDSVDDEFEKIIQHSHLQNLGSEYSSFTVEYLVSSLAQTSRTIALLTELLQASFDHYVHGRPEEERPGLTSQQVELLVAFFENGGKFNQSVLDIQEAAEDEDE